MKSTINVCGYVVYAEGRKEEMSLGLNNSSYMSEHFIYFLRAMHSITEKVANVKIYIQYSYMHCSSFLANIMYK